MTYVLAWWVRVRIAQHLYEGT